MQRDRHHCVHIRASAVPNQWTSWFANQSTNRSISSNFSSTVARASSSSWRKTLPSNRQAAQSGSKLRAGSLAESFVKCDSIGDRQSANLALVATDAAERGPDPRAMGRRGSANRSFSHSRQPRHTRVRTSPASASQREMPRRVQTASDKEMSSPEACSSRLCDQQ